MIGVLQSSLDSEPGFVELVVQDLVAIYRKQRVLDMKIGSLHQQWDQLTSDERWSRQEFLDELVEQLSPNT